MLIVAAYLVDNATNDTSQRRLRFQSVRLFSRTTCIINIRSPPSTDTESNVADGLKGILHGESASALSSPIQRELKDIGLALPRSV